MEDHYEDPRRGRLLSEMEALPPDHPDRAADVLLYLNGGSAWGIGKYEWDTIKAALAATAKAPARE